MGRSGAVDRESALLGILVVLAANGVYLSGLTSVIDPGGSMDPLYIRRSQLPVAQILDGSPAWGPLYALWLKLLGTFWADPLDVFAANVCLISVALTSLTFVYLILATQRALLATAVALLVLVSDLNVPLESNAYALAWIVVLAALCVAEGAGSRAGRALVVSVGAMLASYARPELYLAAWLLLGFAVYRAAGDSATERRQLFRAAAVVGLAAVLLGGWLGTPLFSPYHANDRLFAAFREHFAWNWNQWNGEWLSFGVGWSREFGAAASLAEAFAANPQTFLRHLADNLVGAIVGLGGASFAHFPILLPPAQSWAAGVESVAVGLGALAAMLGVAVSREARAQALARFGDRAVLLLLVALPPLLSAVLVYPRSRYLMIPGMAVLLASSFAAATLLPEHASRGRAWPLLVAALLVAAVPSPFALPPNVEARRDVTNAVRRIRDLGLEPPVRVLTITDGIADLLGEGFEGVRVWERGDLSLERYIDAQRIDVIVTTERGRKSFIVDDPYWDRVQLEPRSTGFEALPSSGNARVWVSVARLAGGPPQ